MVAAIDVALEAPLGAGVNFCLLKGLKFMFFVLFFEVGSTERFGHA